LGDILDDEELSTRDRVKIACFALSEGDARPFGCRCARRALARERYAGREPLPASWAAVSVAERYARGGATLAELREAEAAGWKEERTGAPAVRAAYSAADSINAREGALWAANYAASSAYEAADDANPDDYNGEQASSARDAEREEQLEDLRAVTEEP